MGKIAIIRSVFGGYDNILPALRGRGIDNYIFTNNDIDVTGYNIIKIENPLKNQRRESRRYKMQPWNHVPGYNYYIYLDGSIEMLADPKRLIRKYLKGFDLAVLKHPWRNCIYAEAKECERMGYVNNDKLNKQISIIKKERYPKNNGLTENGVMIWRDTAKNREFGKAWWEFYQKHTQRDQLSFCYIAWKYNLEYNLIEDNIRREPIMFKYVEHKR